MKHWKRKKRIITKRKPAFRKITNDALLLNRAYTAGAEVAVNTAIVNSLDKKMELNKHWNAWRTTSFNRVLPWENYCNIAQRYVLGFSQKMGWPEQGWLLIPTVKKVAAIVTVMNEEKTIVSVIEQLNRLPLHEMIVVVNGTTDNSFSKIRQQSKAIIVQYTEPLGHDVGRAIGAKIATSDILLFLDGDFPIFAEHLIPFIYLIDQGKDIVLNDISPFISYFNKRDAVTMMKEFLNRTLHRGDLKANSMTAIPHALSKQAVVAIGYNDLAIPPKAQAKAIQLGLSVVVSISVDVISNNRQRDELNQGRQSPVADLIIGDHLEALHSIMMLKGGRLDYGDEIRDRALMRGE